MTLKINNAKKMESSLRFTPKTSTVPFMDVFKVVQTKYKDAFDYLEDK